MAVRTGWFQVLPVRAWKRPRSMRSLGLASTRTASPLVGDDDDQALVADEQAWPWP